MTWIDWLCLAIVIAGFVLFLYGANYYNALIGWLGVFLLIAGVASLIAFSIYHELTKKAAI